MSRTRGRRPAPAVRPAPAPRLTSLVLLLERLDPRDSDDGAVDRVVELIAAQDDVEGLVPRHVGQLDVDRALDVRVDDHVQAADVGERAQHRAQVDAVEIEAQRISGVLPRLLRALLLRRAPAPAADVCGGCAAALACCAWRRSRCATRGRLGSGAGASGRRRWRARTDAACAGGAEAPAPAHAASRGGSCRRRTVRDTAAVFSASIGSSGCAAGSGAVMEAALAIACSSEIGGSGSTGSPRTSAGVITTCSRACARSNTTARSRPPSPAFARRDSSPSARSP